MNTLKWGIIGCGDVTEKKSGPAFNKVPQSSLVAVMRRDAEKASDFAKRHGVLRWYNTSDAIINDPEVNAIYIATPPLAHEELCMAALHAGKPVYVEKPMALTAAAASRITLFANQLGVPLCVAHYRRAWPLFLQISQLIQEGTIGIPRFARLVYTAKAPTPEQLLTAKMAWRVNPEESGGGLFYDLAPHQLDIMLFLFGAANKVQGIATNQAGLYNAEDAVTGHIGFENGTHFSGVWNFAASSNQDYCEIEGSEGKISFSFFGNPACHLHLNGSITPFHFTPEEHVQQPMIALVTNFFLGKGSNPSPGQNGVTVMDWMEKMKQFL